jgi:hypothetical protein
MNKEFVTYEQALALKELGFDEPCLAYFDAEKVFKFPGTTMCNRNFLDLLTVTVPLYQQAFRWLYYKLDIKDGIMPLDKETQDSLLKELIYKLSSKHLLV